MDNLWKFVPKRERVHETKGAKALGLVFPEHSPMAKVHKSVGFGSAERCNDSDNVNDNDDDNDDDNDKPLPFLPASQKLTKNRPIVLSDGTDNFIRNAKFFK